MRTRQIAACVLAVGALLTGCQSTITGNPAPNAGSPTEPSFPTPRPSRSSTLPPTSTSSRAPTPTPTAAPPSAEALPPQNGYVFIETKSAKTRCQISAEEVGCESAFTNPPEVDGLPASGVRLTAAGQVQWTDGNLGDIPVETIDYRTYSAEGWTIVATEDGTRFTNEGTRRGMFISVSGVQVF
jgi:hypothetical protein